MMPGDPTLIDGAPIGAGEHEVTSGTLTAALALEDEQRRSERRMMQISVVLGVLGAALLNTLQRDLPGRTLLTALALAIALWSSAFLLATRRARPMPPSGPLGLSALATGVWLAALAAVGVFSLLVFALFVGVLYEAQSTSRARAWLVYLSCAVGYAALVTSALLGWLPQQHAVVHIAPGDWPAGVAAAVMFEVFLGLMFVFGREGRRNLSAAMQRLDRAQTAIGAREALLREARADLAGALGAGRLGRFSGLAVGPYRVEDVIGRGAMGEVYAAVEVERSRPVALKLLHSAACADLGAVRRFFREAEVTSALSSRHIVQVLGSGYADDGTPYLAMERLTGDDLAHHLRERGRFTLSDTLTMASHVAEALEVARDADVVHRDVKPQNVFLHQAGGEETWKVLDFGVSKVAESAQNLTGGAAVGTPSYMAPEQAEGREVDHRADVFSLAVLCYRALTGRPAFTGVDALATMYNVVHAQPAQPALVEPGAVDVELVLALGLAKQRERRLRSARSFVAALRDAARGELDPRLAEDARALLAESPWSTDGVAPASRRH